MKYFDGGIEVLNIINQNGYDAYFIGGVVRDYLLNLKINDIDIATNMPIEKLKNLFKINDNGLKYGSVIIYYKEFSFEITHFRKDINYLDHRHPQIEYVDCLSEDVKRRDFTINALAMDKDKKVIDLVQGLADLNNKIIRCINNPDQSFNEDALRILRALYFSSKLGFKIEEETLNSMIKFKYLLANLSNERIYYYFIKILYANFDLGLEYIHRYDLFSHISDFKNWLNIVKNTYNLADLSIYYFYKYNKFAPICNILCKKRCKIFKDLIDSNFSNYFIYLYQNEIKSLIDVFANVGYNSNLLKNKIANLKLHDDKELAVSKAEIAKMFNGQMISIAIKEVIIAILDGKIANTKKDILIFLEGLDVIKC